MLVVRLAGKMNLPGGVPTGMSVLRYGPFTVDALRSCQWVSTSQLRLTPPLIKRVKLKRGGVVAKVPGGTKSPKRLLIPPKSG